MTEVQAAELLRRLDVIQAELAVLAGVTISCVVIYILEIIRKRD